MAKVSLRIYNREIETMVDRGQLDEAIAHCRHILNVFPKNLDTYRLIGKAYLEARRYGEATDIFERLLMAVPDDFVSHVGMSIIRDEQNEMDAAIWHMQRAFEVQPSNAAIQGELQRLFGRRDGVEPPKIRLTRGALAHMYVQGELYPQAISEIKAVLEEDPERQDMQVLLARAFFHAGQKNEAAEICSQLLRKYPYCFDANRVLVELLPETERGESTQVYRRRVNELDPYVMFTTSSVFHSEEIPDAAVSLERLDWNGQPVDLGQEWRGIGPAEETAASDQEPDWLTADYPTGPFNASIPAEEPASVSGSDDDIPDFLRDAGWGKDTGAFKEGSGSFEAAEEQFEQAELAEGDLPDWIKAMAPTGASLAGSPPQSEPEEDLTQDNVPDWLQGLGKIQDTSPAEPTLEEGDLPDWLADLKPGSEAAQEPQPEEEGIAEPAGEEEFPDWIAAMKPAGEAPQATQPEESAMAEPTSEEDLPDWLADLKPESEAPQQPQPMEEVLAEPAGDEELPSWLADLKPGSEGTQEPQPEEHEIAEPTAGEEFPDWIAELKPGSESLQEPQPEEEGVAQPTEEELPDWIAAMKPAGEALQEEELMAEPAVDEGLPDWLQAVQGEGEKVASQETPTEPFQEPVQEFSEMSSESLSDWQLGDEEKVGAVDFDATDTGKLGTTADEQDDAIAWLEGLAAKHGAKPEELVTKPEERTETEPEWVQQARAFKDHETPEELAAQEEPTAGPSEDTFDFLAEMQVEPTEAPVDMAPPAGAGAPVPSAQEQDDAIAWLESLAAKHGAKPEELVTDPEARKETAPDWVQKAAEESSVSQPPTEQAAPLEEPVESIPEWIEPAKEEPGSLYAEREDTQPPKPLYPAAADETGIWLRGLEESEQEPVASEAEPAASSKDEDVPDWLREMEAEVPKTEAGQTFEKEEQVPDWLSGMEAQPSSVEADQMPTEEEQEVPDWLSELSESKEEPSKSEAEPQEVPDWLLGVEKDSSTAEPFPDFPPVGERSVEPGLEVEPQSMEAPTESEDFAFTDWLKTVEPEGAGTQVEEPVSEEAATDDFPSWLAGLDEKPVQPEAVVGADDDLPEWLRSVDEQEPVQAQPTAPTDWQPAEFTTPFTEEPSVPVVEPEPVIEEPPVQAVPPVTLSPEPQPVEPVAQARSEMAGMLSFTKDPALVKAQNELTSGNISVAMQSYEKLIRKGKMLDEIIFDLREALYRYPVDVSIMQALGDAYMRANRLQDALDSYTKAEELLR